MNQTQDLPEAGAAPAPPPPPSGGPRVSGEQMRDLRRLRRSRTDRRIAGVAGGLGRHLDVDPTLLRVGFVVLCFFGGAGILLYAALWLLVPEEGHDRATIATSEETRKVLLIGAAALATIFILGQGWNGWWFGPGIPVGLLVVGVVVFLVSRDQRRNGSATVAPPPPYPGAHPSASATTTETVPFVAVPGATTAAGPASVDPPPPAAPPRWAPPPYVAPPPRRRRTGLVLFWPALALIAIALGLLGVYDNTGHSVTQPAYPALALAVVGVMLTLGAFLGRPGGLILLGVVASITLAIGSATGGFQGGRTLSYAPTSAGEVRSAYPFENGEVVLDLTDVSDLAALDGRTISVTGGAGHIEVIVPRDLNVEANAAIDVVGGYDLGDGLNGGGFDQSVSTTLDGASADPTVNLDLDLRVGAIEVRQQ